MDTKLQDFFIPADRSLLLFDFEKKREGGFATYLPLKGQFGFCTDKYSSEDLKHPFMRYIFQVFGKPEISFLQEKDLLPWKGARILAPHQRSHIVQEEQMLGEDVRDVYDELNNKEEFQKLVRETLGESYSTDPQGVPAQSSIHDVMRVVAELREKSNKVVIRVPDERIAEGGGDGVRFITDEKEVEPALHSIKDVIRDNRLATRVMVERFIPSLFSPSTTFFLTSSEIIPLTINNQILENGIFIAGTNILPEGMNQYVNELQIKGMELARKMQSMGARGFLGIDWLVGKKMVAIEANYRETGATIPEVWVNKANQFEDEKGWSEWVHVTELDFNKKNSSIVNTLHILQQAGVLFKKNDEVQSFDALQCIPSYGISKEGYDLVFFWRKGSIEHKRAFQRINEILVLLGTDKQVQIP